MALSVAQDRLPYTPTPPAAASPAMNIAHIVDPMVPSDPAASTAAPSRPHMKLPKATDPAKLLASVPTMDNGRIYWFDRPYPDCK